MRSSCLDRRLCYFSAKCGFGVVRAYLSHMYKLQNVLRLISFSSSCISDCNEGIASLWIPTLCATRMAELRASQNALVFPSHQDLSPAKHKCCTRDKQPLTFKLTHIVARLSPTSSHVLRMSARNMPRIVSIV